MVERTIDPAYLAYQYGDSERLRIRVEAHERYSERSADWHALAPAWAGVAPGDLVLDVGCGFGAFHPGLSQAGARVVGLDVSAGMLQEARAQAVREGLSVRLMQADAQTLPIADQSCDVVLAMHMLYHVPDIRRALQELRRVVKVGGRVLISTNAADHSARLHEIHHRAARELGFRASQRSGFERFSLAELPLVRSVFPTVEVHPLPNAFVFPSTEAALRFYASGRVDAIDERRADGSHRPLLLEKVGGMIDEIIRREGAFRVTKDAAENSEHRERQRLERRQRAYLDRAGPEQLDGGSRQRQCRDERAQPANALPGPELEEVRVMPEPPAQTPAGHWAPVSPAPAEVAPPLPSA